MNAPAYIEDATGGLTIHIGASPDGGATPGPVTIHGTTYHYRGCTPEGDHVWYSDINDQQLIVNENEAFITQPYLN